MNKEENNFVSPQEDERVYEILTGLMQGKTRDELAEEFGHKNYKTLDIYMRRRGYRFNTRLGNYTSNVDEPSENFSDGSKASRVVQLIKEYSNDPLIVCTKLGFKDMNELAVYMTSKNFKWNTELQNYEKQGIVELSSSNEEEEPVDRQIAEKDVERLHELLEYMPLLKMLQSNKEKLKDLLVPYGKGVAMPRYTIPGVAKTKTVQMIHTLGDLVTEYAEEKNISQRDIFEVALIEFFRKYGFEREIERVLRQ